MILKYSLLVVVYTRPYVLTTATVIQSNHFFIVNSTISFLHRATCSLKIWEFVLLAVLKTYLSNLLPVLSEWWRIVHTLLADDKLDI